MSRTRKICIASTVVMVGVLLAWPFRRTGDASLDVPEPVEILRSANGDPITAATPALSVLDEKQNISNEPISAFPASAHLATQKQSEIASSQGFDVANHPALASLQHHHRTESPETEANSLVTDNSDVDSSRPAYSTISAPPAASSSDDLWPEEVLHVVRNGDTLERLAERYLDDAQRAFEIFELNRDQLSNPHLLPIGVELRIPPGKTSPID